MDVSDLKGLFAEVKKRMEAQLDHVRRELGGVRTGRASVGILDTVHVEAYGAHDAAQPGGVAVDPRADADLAQPFDPSLMGAIEKAIRASSLGLNPTNDGKVVRIPIPSLTEERRKELSRIVHKHAEEGRNAVRLGPPRRQRPAQEAAEGPRHLRRRRAARPRRRAEDHRSAHHDDRRPAEEEGRRAAPTRARRSRCRGSPISSAASRAAHSRTTRASSSISAPAALPCWRATTSPRRAPGGANRWPAASRRCGATAS